MQVEVKRRIVWFSVFMVWLGMVGAILIYQEVNPGALPSLSSEVSGSPDGVSQSADPATTGNAPTESETVQQANPIKPPILNAETGNGDFFVQYRLDRDKARSDQIGAYRETLNSPNTDPSTKKLYQEKILKIQEVIEQEMQIESLIKLQGYTNALAFIGGDNTINLVIQTNGLKEEDVLKISDIVTQITNMRAEDITIIEKRGN